jgi:hypothetical protein
MKPSGIILLTTFLLVAASAAGPTIFHGSVERAGRQ